MDFMCSVVILKEKSSQKRKAELSVSQSSLST